VRPFPDGCLFGPPIIVDVLIGPHLRKTNVGNNDLKITANALANQAIVVPRHALGRTSPLW
jgi:hypothetical protein